MEFVHSNPPSADDLITILEQNTWMTIAAAESAVETLLQDASQGCVDPLTGKKDAVKTASLLGEVLTKVKGGVGSSYLQGVRSYYSPKKQARPAAIQDYLTLPTVYHKLVMMCIAHPQLDDDVSFQSMCVTNNTLNWSPMHASPVDRNPVFDLVPVRPRFRTRFAVPQLPSLSSLAVHTL